MKDTGPQLALTDFKFVAGIDWIMIEIETRSPTNFQTIRRRLPPRSFVDPIDTDWAHGGATTHFTVRIQDPPSWAFLDCALSALADEVPIVRIGPIRAIEVYLDAYPRSESTSGTIDMAEVFYRELKDPVSDNHRLVGKRRGLVRGIATRRDVGVGLQSGVPIAIGNKRDPVSQRVYAKTTDNGNQNLPPALHRARIEVTLKGDGIPARLANDWTEFRFEELSQHFKFREPDDANLPTLSKLVIDHAPQPGALRAGGTSRRLFSGLTVANRDLNRIAYDRFRSLTMKLHRPMSLRAYRQECSKRSIAEKADEVVR